VKKIRSNNGSEFKNLQVEEYLEEEGVKHEFSAPYTPQQNGVGERKNMTFIDMARMMLGEFKTPERFWSEAVNTSCHAINWLYLHRLCWGPSAYEGPQKQDLTVFLEYNV
jgi:transposase InsO family protein